MQLPDIGEEGYLVDPNYWNEDIARVFAAPEAIELTPTIGMAFISSANITRNIRWCLMFDTL